MISYSIDNTCVYIYNNNLEYKYEYKNTNSYAYLNTFHETYVILPIRYLIYKIMTQLSIPINNYHVVTAVLKQISNELICQLRIASIPIFGL